MSKDYTLDLIEAWATSIVHLYFFEEKGSDAALDAKQELQGVFDELRFLRDKIEKAQEIIVRGMDSGSTEGLDIMKIVEIINKRQLS